MDAAIVERLPLTLSDLARAVAGRVVRGVPDTAIEGVSIDSRTVRPGDLFVAIRGERFDGHRFVAAAFAAGRPAPW